MAQTLSVNEAQTLISDTLDSVWEAATPASPPAFEQYMNVGNMTRGEHTNYRMSGFGKFAEREELEDFEYDQYNFSEKQTVLPRNWAKGFKVSEEVVEDLADSGGEDRAKLASYAEVTKRFRRSAIWTVGQECADILLNGTSTATQYVLRDGIALFGSHVTVRNPQVTQSNLATHASLSQSALVTMTAALDMQLDDTGDYISDDGQNILVVSGSDAFRAYEILHTAGQVDTANNNVNSLKRSKYRVVEDRYLNINAASYAGYFLLREGVHSLTWLWRKKPDFKQTSDFDQIAMKFRARFRGEAFVKDWRGAVGDNGS